MIKEFRISEVDTDKTLAKAHKMASRGRDKGLSGGFAVSVQEREEEVEGISSQYKVLVIEGELLKFGGWEFVGVAEFIEDQTILKGFSDELPIQSSEVKKGYCDHCKKVRNRGKIIFVKSEDGMLSQVGSSCVKDFIGWDFSASALITEEDFEEEFGGYAGGGISAIGTLDLIAYAVKAVAKVGYVKADEGLSTKDLVMGKLRRLNHYLELWKEYEIGDVTEAEYLLADKLIAFGKNFEGESSYAQNIRAVCNLNYQNNSTIGIAVSIVKAEANQREKEIIDKIDYKKEQFAPDGSKIEVVVIITGINTFESNYGYTTIFTFVSEDHFQLKWFSSKGFNYEIGDKVILKGTVKGSEEYKGNLSTLLTRCKMAISE